MLVKTTHAQAAWHCSAVSRTVEHIEPHGQRRLADHPRYDFALVERGNFMLRIVGLILCRFA
jgi:hypothetical protein